jgi:hypothetical protein
MYLGSQQVAKKTSAVILLALVLAASCIRADPGSWKPASSKAGEKEFPYDRWGWIEVEADGAKYVVVILHDTTKEAQMKMTFFKDGQPAIMDQDTFGMRSLAPILDKWVMRRDATSKNSFVGAPTNREFMVAMNAAVYETDSLIINGKAIKPLRFGYRFNPYQMLMQEDSLSSFREAADREGFPEVVKGKEDVLQVERAKWAAERRKSAAEK